MVTGWWCVEGEVEERRDCLLGQAAGEVDRGFGWGIGDGIGME